MVRCFVNPNIYKKADILIKRGDTEKNTKCSPCYFIKETINDVDTKIKELQKKKNIW